MVAVGICLADIAALWRVKAVILAILCENVSLFSITIRTFDTGQRNKSTSVSKIGIFDYASIISQNQCLVEFFNFLFLELTTHHKYTISVNKIKKPQYF